MKVKCYGSTCEANNIKYPKEELKTHNRKRYCSKCYAKVMKSVTHRNILYYFIEKESGVKYPTGRMLAQIKRLRVKRNYTYFGIYIALGYMVNKLGKSMRNDYFLGYVPYIYDESQSWYLDYLTKKNERKKSLSNQVMNRPARNINNFTYKPKKRTPDEKGIISIENAL